MFERYQHEEQHHAVHYAKDEVDEFDDTSVPLFLKITYLVLPIWGIVWASLFWDGTFGWFDRGYWKELQQAANTKAKQHVTNVKPNLDKLP